MEADKTEELQRSIEALLSTIEAQKLALRSLVRDRGPLVLFAPSSPIAEAPITTTPAGARVVR